MHSKTFLMRWPRPRPERSLRRWVLALLLTGLGAFAVPPLVSRLAASGPAFRSGPARAAVDAAARRLAVADPAAARRLGELAAAAAARSDEGADPGAWSGVLANAHAALVAVEAARRDHDELWREIEPRAAAAVAAARRQSEAPGLERREARWVEQAAHQLGLARRLAAEDRFDAAVDAAEHAILHAASVDRSWQKLHRRFEQADLRAQWRTWVDATIAESRKRGTTALIVDKLARRLDVVRAGKRVASFPVELGTRGLERKLHAGDRATPEGRYRVTQVKTGKATKYYKALLIDYPNGEDRSRFELARRQGRLPRGVGIGSLIEIHGDGGQGRDWTDGCVALTNADMDHLFRHVARGTPVTIVGSLGNGNGSAGKG